MKIAIDTYETNMDEVRSVKKGTVTAVSGNTVYVLASSGTKVVEIHLEGKSSLIKAGVSVKISSNKKDPHVVFNVGQVSGETASKSTGSGCETRSEHVTKIL